MMFFRPPTRMFSALRARPASAAALALALALAASPVPAEGRWREDFFDYFEARPVEAEAAGHFFDFPPRLAEVHDRSPKSIQARVEALASDEARERLEAFSALFYIGEPARAQLWRAANSGQEPLQGRAREILELWENYKKLYELHSATARRAERFAVSDLAAPAGEGTATAPSPPLPLPENLSAADGALALAFLPGEPAACEGVYKGARLVLANRTGRPLHLEALENRLPIILEAKDRDGRWRPLEFLPEPCCGRAYADATLPPGFYWGFSVPVHGGNFETALRYRAMKASAKPGQAEPMPDLLSNEFPGSIYESQFARGGEPAPDAQD